MCTMISNLSLKQIVVYMLPIPLIYSLSISTLMFILTILMFVPKNIPQGYNRILVNPL